MADSASTVYFELDAKTTKFLSELNKAASAWDNTQRRMKSSAQDGAQAVGTYSSASARAINESAAASQRAAGVWGQAMGTIRSAIAATTAVLGVRELVDYAQTWTTITNRLRLVSDSSDELASRQQELFQIAQRTGETWSSVTNVFADLTQAMKATVGATGQEAAAVEALADAAEIGGKDLSDIENRLTRFTRGLADGTADAREFSTILLQVPRAAQAIADGLGTTVQRVRELSKEGQLSSTQIVNALASQGPKLRDEANRVVEDIGKTFARVNNEITRALGAPLSGVVIATANVMADGFIDVVKTLEQMKNTFAIVGAAGAVAASAIVNSWQFLNGILISIETVLTFIEERYRSFTGQKPFANAADGIAEATADLARLRDQLDNIVTPSAAPELFKRLTKEIAETEAKLGQLDPGGQLQPLVAQYRAIQEQIAAANRNVFPSDSAVEDAKRRLGTLEALIEGKSNALGAGVRDQVAALDRQLADLAARKVALQVNAGGDAERQLAAIGRSLAGLQAQKAEITARLNGDAGPRAAELAQQIAALNGRRAAITATAGGDAAARLAELEQQARALEARRVRIAATTDPQAAEQLAAVDRQLTALQNRKAALQVSADGGTAQRDLAAIDRQLAALQSQKASVAANLTGDAGERVAKLRGDIERLTAQRATIAATITGDAPARLGEIDRAIEELQARRVVIQTTAGPEGFQALTKLDGELRALQGRKVAIQASVDGQASAELAGIDRQLKALRAQAATVTATADDQATAKLRGVEATIARLTGRKVALEAVVTGKAPQELAALEAEAARLREQRITIAAQADVTGVLKELDSLQAKRVELQAVIKATTSGTPEVARSVRALEEQAASLRQQMQGLGLNINAEGAKTALGETRERLNGLLAQLEKLKSGEGFITPAGIVAEVNEVAAALQAVTARATESRGALNAFAGVRIDSASILTGVGIGLGRQKELEAQATAEINRTIINGERGFSQELTSILEATAQQRVGAAKEAARLKALASGEVFDTKSFDEQAARLTALQATFTDFANRIEAGRDKIMSGGTLITPGLSQDQFQGIVEADARAQAVIGENRVAAQEALAAAALAGQTTLNAQLLELAAQQARDEVIARFEAKQAALGETGEPTGEDALALQAEIDAAALERARQFQAKLTETEAKGAQQRRNLDIRMAQLRFALAEQVTGNLIGLLSVLGRENKGFAIAAIALEKGLAIARVVINTQVASSLAAAQFGVYAAPAIAAIQAAGALQIGIIAATGVLEAGQVSGGGGGGGGGFGGFSGGASGTPANPNVGSDDGGRASNNTVTVQFLGDVIGWDEAIQSKFITALRDVVDGKDVIIFSGNSRQAQEIREGG